MSARGFGSVLWAGAVAGAALGFYLVSLKVASERAELEQVETKIALAERDVRLLQTEIGTRGRLAQLERWNVKFIRLSAPSADQFIDGGFQLASLVAPRKKPAIEVPVVLASAPVEQTIPQRPKLTTDDAEESGTIVQRASRSPSEMMHVASYNIADKPASPKPVAAKPAATKQVKSAFTDPLAPLSGVKPKSKGMSAIPTNGTNQKRPLKDSDFDQ